MKKGFTLIELIITITIISILSVVVFAKISGHEPTTKAKALMFIDTMQKIRLAFQMAYLEEGRSEWWTEEELNMGTNPSIDSIIDIDPVHPLYTFSHYFKAKGITNPVTLTQYVYDYDGNPGIQCNGVWDDGVNIMVDGLENKDWIYEVDKIIDGEENNTCGLIRHGANEESKTFWISFRLSDDGESI